MAGKPKSKQTSGKAKAKRGTDAGSPSKRAGGSSGSKMKTSTKVVIVIFAIIMALAMMLPSFASVVASNNEAAQQEEQNQNTNESSSSSDNSNSSSDDDAATEGVPEDLQSLATQYYSRTSDLEERLDADPDNLAALLNLAQNYMNWGYQAVAQSDTDEETSYADGLLDQAIDYYDRYLALNDSNSAKVDRALCEYYKGDTEAALSALEQITTDSPDFAPAWANLGMLYEQTGDTDKAKEAYQQAVDTDPDDEYGAKSFANRRLVLITANEGSSSDDATSVVSNTTDDDQGLTDTLAEESGTDF